MLGGQDEASALAGTDACRRTAVRTAGPAAHLDEDQGPVALDGTRIEWLQAAFDAF